MGCIERVICTAARLIRGIPRTGHVSAYMLDVLHWLPPSSGSCSVLVPFSGGVSWVLLRPTSEIFALPPWAPEVAVHSAHRNRGYSLFLFLVPPQPRPVQCAFSVVGPSVWNGLPLSQRLLPRILSDTFYSSLKTFLFSRARVRSASE